MVVQWIYRYGYAVCLLILEKRDVVRPDGSAVIIDAHMIQSKLVCLPQFLPSVRAKGNGHTAHYDMMSGGIATINKLSIYMHIYIYKMSLYNHTPTQLCP